MNGAVILIHGLNTGLLWYLVYTMSGRRGYAWAASLFFAAFPLSYEAVSYVAAIPHTLLTLITLITLILYHRGRQTNDLRYLVSAQGVVLFGLFTHENGIIIPALLVAWEILIETKPLPGRRLLLQIAPFFVEGVFFFIVWSIVPKPEHAGIQPISNILQSSLPVFQMFFYPLLPLLSLFHMGNPAQFLVMLALFGCIILVAYWIHAERVLAFGVIWYVIFWIPSLIFLEPSYITGSPRLFYLPSIAATLFWSIPFWRINRLAWSADLHRYLIPGLQLCLALFVLVPSLLFIRSEIGLYEYNSQIVKSMRNQALAAQKDRELVFVNLPFYFSTDLGFPADFPNPYPPIHAGAVFMPPYANAHDFIIANGGPDRPARTVAFDTYPHNWPVHGDGIFSSTLRPLIREAQVFVFHLSADPINDLSRDWRAGPVPQQTTPDADLLSPLFMQPESTSSAETTSIPQSEVVFDDNLTLVGSKLEPEQVLPGKELAISLYWRVKRALRPDATIQVLLRDRFGNAFIEDEFWPDPAASWEPDELYVTRWHWEIPSNVAKGDTKLEIKMQRRVDSELLPARDITGRDLGDTPQIASFLIGQTSSATIDELAQSRPRQEILGGKIVLVGYRLTQGQLRPGESLGLNLYWKATEVLDRNFTVFVQILNGQGQVVAQKDNEPNQGNYPTSTWIPGEAIRDAYEVQLPTDLPPGNYQLITGMYALPSTKRLPVTLGGSSQGDTISVGDILVQK
ncbi:MAG: hypothetical protein EXR62_04470 [Chloroflexi bacterium]|nr:hypothetical protein [Chloroflexota bacterium]